MNLMHKLSESLTYHEKFLLKEREQYRMFYTGRWIVFGVLVRFIMQVFNKFAEKREEDVEIAKNEK